MEFNHGGAPSKDRPKWKQEVCVGVMISNGCYQNGTKKWGSGWWFKIVVTECYQEVWGDGSKWLLPKWHQEVWVRVMVSKWLLPKWHQEVWVGWWFQTVVTKMVPRSVGCGDGSPKLYQEVCVGGIVPNGCYQNGTKKLGLGWWFQMVVTKWY